MLNLAPWRYRQVLAADGGPIEWIESGVVSVLGEPLHQANAYLKEGLRRRGGEMVLYGKADGCGTARDPSVARHKAISESLERWAHAVSSKSGSEYGYDVDVSSNGMAAFPGVFARQARERAWAEAVERHTVMSWWTGAAQAESRPSPWDGIDLVEIDSSAPGIKVAMVHAAVGPNLHAYGHAAGPTLAKATWHATVELARAQFVIARYERRGQALEKPASNLFERRCLFFAGQEGHALFQSRLRGRKSKPFSLRVLFDGEVRGPWSDYACVWRTVFEPADPSFLTPREDFFFW